MKQFCPYSWSVRVQCTLTSLYSSFYSSVKPVPSCVIFSMLYHVFYDNQNLHYTPKDMGHKQRYNPVSFSLIGPAILCQMCHRCHGMGFIMCHRCHGSGHNSCGSCHGSGRCMQMDPQTGNQRQVMCHSCNGSGRRRYAYSITHMQACIWGSIVALLICCYNSESKL